MTSTDTRQPISQDALDQLFFNARTHNAWRDKPVPEDILKSVADTLKMAPTSANCSPARLVFVTSPEAKARLKPHLMDGNVEKTMTAPVCAIIGHDLAFYEHLPQLFPHTDARSWFVDQNGQVKSEEHVAETAFRNGTLQGAYLILAARAHGLDCGPMSGFDADGVTKDFFAGTKVKANFLCNLGYGDGSKLFERSPRFDFGEFCKIV